MAQSNFATRLTRELRRSPKKTAVLALLGVVALWFWAPLAWKWIAPQEGEAATSTTPAAEATAVTPGVSLAGPEASPAAGAKALDWKELADASQHDPLLSSARLDEKVADPFAKPKVEQPPATEEAVENKSLLDAIAAAFSPEQLGLVLSSTITGGRRAVATINGQSCGVGDVIVVPDGGRDYEFNVASINADEVVLAAGTQRFTLSTQRPDSTMQFSPAGSTSAVDATSGGQRIVIGVRLGE